MSRIDPKREERIPEPLYRVVPSVQLANGFQLQFHGCEVHETCLHLALAKALMYVITNPGPGEDGHSIYSTPSFTLRMEVTKWES